MQNREWGSDRPRKAEFGQDASVGAGCGAMSAGMDPFFDVLTAPRPKETGADTTEGFVGAKVASCGGAVVDAKNVAAKTESRRMAS